MSIDVKNQILVNVLKVLDKLIDFILEVLNKENA